MRRPRLPKPRIAVPEPLISWGASLLTAVWGGFWVWFALMHILGDDASAADIIPALLFATPVLILSLLAIATPRLGGLLMLPAAVFGAWFFDDPGARMLLATPALLLGATLVWLGPWRRRSIPIPQRGLRRAHKPKRAQAQTH